MIKKFIGVVSACAVILGVFVPAKAVGAEERFTTSFADALASSVDAAKYPGGMFDFLTARVEAKEGQTSIEYDIVRRGNISTPASVRLKSVDISAKYGADYTFALMSSWNVKTLENAESAEANTDELRGQKTMVEINAQAENNAIQNSAPQNNPKTPTKTVVETQSGSSNENGDNQAKAQPLPARMPKNTLAGIAAVQNGAYHEQRDWKETDQAHKKQLEAGYKQMYEDLPGAFLDLQFAPGDFAKAIRINIAQDDISEDDEQVLFALLNAKGADVSENPTGYLNIKDDDAPREQSDFGFEAPSVEIPRDATTAKVAITRHKNLERYETAVIVSASDSAVSGQNYRQFEQTVQFIPAQTRAVIEIPILTRGGDEWLRFFVRVAETGAQAEVLLEPNTPGISLNRAVLGTLQNLEASADTSRVAWRWLSGDTQRLDINKSLTKNADLSMISRVEMTISNDSPGTYYEQKSGKKTNSGYHSDFRNYVDFGSIRSYDERVYKNSVKWTHDLTPDERKQGSITVGVRTANAATKNSNGNFKDVVAYYLPVQIQLLDPERTDADATITPKKFTAADESEAFGASQMIGKLDFQSGGNTDTNTQMVRFKNFYSGDNVNLVPQFANDLSSEVKNGVYLWGFKLKNKIANAKIPYYYVDKTTFSINDLYTEKLKDYQGNSIKQGDVMTVINGVPTYQILPVYKQKPVAITLSVNGDKTEFRNSKLKNAPGDLNNTIVLGALDTLAISSRAKGGEYIKAWTNFSLDTQDYWKLSRQDVNEVEKFNLAQSGNAWTTSEVGADLGDAGVWEFKAGSLGKAYNHLVAQYDTASVSVTVHPLALEPESLRKSRILYLDKDGNTQTADYTHESSEGSRSYSRGSSIKITPYNIWNVYRLLSSPKNAADEGKFITRWFDFTGDENNDGVLDAHELKNLPKGAQIHPRAVAGEMFPFVPTYLSGKRKIYYTTAMRQQNPSHKEQKISGTVVRTEVPILDKNNSALKPAVIPLEGVSVEILGQTQVTDKTGHFEFSSSEFSPNDAYAANFNYNGQIYTTILDVNVATEVDFDQYDYFNIKNFQAFRSSGNGSPQKLDAKTQITNEDAKHRYTFEIEAKIGNMFAKDVIVRRYSNKNVLKAQYFAKYDNNSKSYNIEFNPASENVGAGDYLTIQVIDTNERVYEEHKVGFEYVSAVSAIAILNTFETPATKAVDLIGSVDTIFDLGLQKTMNKYALDLMKRNGEITDEEKPLLDSNNEPMLDQHGNPLKYKSRTISLGFRKSFNGSVSGKNAGEKVAEDAKKMNEDADAGQKKKAESETEETAKEAVDKDSPEGKRKANMTNSYEVNMSVGVSLEMKTDETGKFYFSNFAVVGALDGAFSQKVEYMTPIGITLFLQLNLSGNADAMMAVEPYNGKRLYIDDGETMDFSKVGRSDVNREYSIYGRLFVTPKINITLGAKASFVAGVSVSGAAQFDLAFSTGSWGSGDVSLNAEVRLELLGGLITKTWNMMNKKYNMFSYSTALLGAEDARYQTISARDFGKRDYLKNRNAFAPLTADNFASPDEKELVHAVFPKAQPHINNISQTGAQTTQLLTYLDDNGFADDLNHTHLLYSIVRRDGDNIQFDTPQFVDTDNTTADDSPYTLDLGGKIAVIWNTPDEPFNEAEKVKDIIQSRTIKMRLFDKSTAQFGDLIDINNRAQHGIFTNHYSSEHPDIFAYNSAGDKNAAPDELVISYLKSEYADHENPGDEEYIGDVFNPGAKLAYRRFNLNTQQFLSFNNADIAKIRASFQTVCAQEVAGAEIDNCVQQNTADYVATFDGEWILDQPFYAYNSASDGQIKVAQNSTQDLKLLEQTSVQLFQDGKNYMVFFVLVDMDGDMRATPNDTAILAIVRDFTDQISYEPTLILASDNVKDSNIQAINSLETDDAELFLINNGNIATFNVRQLLDNRSVKILVDANTAEVVVNSQSENYTGFTTIYQAPENCPVTSISISANDNNLFIVWSENKITYRDGISASSDEAERPENYFAERQLNALEYKSVSVSSHLTGDDGKPLYYPGEVDGQSVDYSSVEDVNGEKGKVHAGDPVIKNSNVHEWTQPVQLTNGQGDNYSDVQISQSIPGQIQILALKGKSKVQTAGDTQISAEDVNDRALILKNYQVGAANYLLNFTQKPGDEIAEVEVKNNSLQNRENVRVKFAAGDEVVDEKTLEKLNAGESARITFNLHGVENLDGLKIKAFVEADGRTFSTDYTYSTASSLEFEGVNTTILGRNQVQIQAQINNLSSHAVSDQKVRLFDAKEREIASTNTGKINALDKTTISLIVDVPEELYGEKTAENGELEQFAHLLLTIDPCAARTEILLERDAPGSYVQKTKDADLVNAQVVLAGTKTPATKLQLQDDVQLQVISGVPDAEFSLELSSSNVAVLEAKNGVLIPKSNGDAVVHASVFVRGAKLTGGVNSSGQTHLAPQSIYTSLPSSLIKQIDIPVHISGKSAPGNLANTGVEILLLLLMIILILSGLKCTWERRRE